VNESAWAGNTFVCPVCNGTTRIGGHLTLAELVLNVAVVGTGEREWEEDGC